MNAYIYIHINTCDMYNMYTIVCKPMYSHNTCRKSSVFDHASSTHQTNASDDGNHVKGVSQQSWESPKNI